MPDEALNKPDETVDRGQIQRPGQHCGRPERRRTGRTVDRDPPELAGDGPPHFYRHAATRKVR